MNKKSFVVHFPIKQEFFPGMSWDQLNQLSWEEFNLLSWSDLTRLIKRYLDYSVQYTKSLAQKITLPTKKRLVPPTFTKKTSQSVLFSKKIELGD